MDLTHVLIGHMNQLCCLFLQRRFLTSIDLNSHFQIMMVEESNSLLTLLYINVHVFSSFIDLKASSKQICLTTLKFKPDQSVIL